MCMCVLCVCLRAARLGECVETATPPKKGNNWEKKTAKKPQNTWHRAHFSPLWTEHMLSTYTYHSSVCCQLTHTTVVYVVNLHIPHVVSLHNQVARCQLTRSTHILTTHIPHTLMNSRTHTIHTYPKHILTHTISTHLHTPYTHIRQTHATTQIPYSNTPNTYWCSQV